jgi:hemerythrin superfamily protein
VHLTADVQAAAGDRADPRTSSGKIDATPASRSQEQKYKPRVEPPTGEDGMAQTFTDAIALLKADHRKVEDLFEKFEKASNDDKKNSLANEICTELKIHTMIEEEIFYPAFRGKIEDDTLDEAYVEHDGAKVLINDIMASRPDADFYDAKVTVLSEEIKHHVHEEEMPSDGMFAQCRRTDVDLVALRDAMIIRKEELLALAKSSGLPAAESRVVNLQPA